MVLDGQRERIVALLERLTDAPHDGLFTAVAALPDDECKRLDVIVADILETTETLAQDDGPGNPS